MPGTSRAARNASATRMSNRYTFGAIFGVDLLAANRREHYRELVGDMIVSYLT